jgi:hypothetical protein
MNEGPIESKFLYTESNCYLDPASGKPHSRISRCFAHSGRSEKFFGHPEEHRLLPSRTQRAVPRRVVENWSIVHVAWVGQDVSSTSETLLCNRSMLIFSSPIDRPMYLGCTSRIMSTRARSTCIPVSLSHVSTRRGCHQGSGYWATTVQFKYRDECETPCTESQTQSIWFTPRDLYT